MLKIWTLFSEGQKFFFILFQGEDDIYVDLFAEGVANEKKIKLFLVSFVRYL